MRWLMITNDFPPTLGGIENYLYSLASRFDPEEVSILTRKVDGWQAFDEQQRFRIHRLDHGVLLPTPRVLGEAQRIVREESIDIVHYGSPMPLPVMAPKLRRTTGTPYSVSLHGGEFVLASRLPALKQVLRRSLSSASCLLCESTFVQRKADRFFDSKIRTEYLPAGVEAERFASLRTNEERSGKTILSVCRLVARKGPMTLVRAMPAVLSRHPEARALIVGGGPDLAKLRRLASDLGVEHAVQLVGPQPWEEIPRFYAQADIFALPTRERFAGLESEGLPLVVLEAAAAGLPAVIGRAGGVTDGVEDEVTGLLVDGRDPDDTARALIRLLDDPDLARQMGRKASERAVRDFRWDDLVKRMREIFEQILS